jgi:uncharacterized membrane protein YeiH
MLVYWLDILGTAVFAISGVLLAGKLRMDPFGVLVLGVVTAVGGGTIRDMALANGPVFWVKDPTDLVVAMVTCLLTIVLVRQPAGCRNGYCRCWMPSVWRCLSVLASIKRLMRAPVRWWRSAWAY